MVFNGKVYLYPSHDIPAPGEFARKDWCCMQDYHVFSSSNLTNWTGQGVIVSQNKVNWVDSTSQTEGPLQVRLNKGDGILLAEVNIPKGPGLENY